MICQSLVILEEKCITTVFSLLFFNIYEEALRRKASDNMGNCVKIVGGSLQGVMFGVQKALIANTEDGCRR